jgi:hypothetical protein
VHNRSQWTIRGTLRTPEEPHQPTLFAEPEFKIVGGKPTIGAVYVTRFQKERWSSKDQPIQR